MLVSRKARHRIPHGAMRRACFRLLYAAGTSCELDENENAPIDSTSHVLLDSPAHAEARVELLASLDAVLARCGLSRENDVASRKRLVCLLLGSPPEHIQHRLFLYPTAYRDILRATARFIKSVYATRWQRE